MDFKERATDLTKIYIDNEEFVNRVLAIRNSLWGWGGNYGGKLGTNNTIDRSSPVQTIAGGTNWKSVSCSGPGTAAIKIDGTLWAWGFNGSGQLGTNNTIDRSSPVQTIAGGNNWAQVSCSESNTAAIKTDGTLWVWGSTYYGQLGTNDSIDQSSPVQTVAGGTNWKQVSCGNDYTAAIKTDGTLWMWGYNTDGKLGTNDTIHRSSPVQTVAGGTNWKQVSCGGLCTAAVKTDGTLWVWGANFGETLGVGYWGNVSSPVQTVAGGTNWKQVSCGPSQYVPYTAAIKTDGTLWLWGSNYHGTLGTNDTSDQSSPVQTIAGGNKWKQVACGDLQTAAIKTDGTLWVWGSNEEGALGINSTVSHSSPVQTVAGGNKWKQVACGGHTMALKAEYLE